MKSPPTSAPPLEMTDLLPCPFCGSSTLRYEFCGSQGYIECNECGTQGPCDERAADPICDLDAACDAWNRRTALAQPEPEGPTDAELITMWATTRYIDQPEGGLAYGRAVLARWGSPAIEPVPVSERLPGPEDCDAWGRCWWFSPSACGPCTIRPCWIFDSETLEGDTHWLPHWALPVPKREAEQ